MYEEAFLVSWTLLLFSVKKKYLLILASLLAIAACLFLSLSIAIFLSDVSLAGGLDTLCLSSIETKYESIARKV